MRIGLGLVAVLFYAIHLAACMRNGRTAEALWACHVADLALGVGLLCRSQTVAAGGALCLVVGTPLWLLDLAGGAELVTTSFLTHGGGLLVGVVALCRFGIPHGVWWKTLVALAVLQQGCRWGTPETLNVNAAFAVYARFQGWFPSYAWYLATLTLVAGLVLWIVERGLRRLLPGRPTVRVSGFWS